MSYLVLARKYRPTTFAEVVGQEHVTRTLGNAFAAGRVHHAFLFCGPRGCGKTTLARIVGKALNCQGDRATTAEPCGVCGACVSINNGSATDYQEMDGASNRGIDAIRELTEAVRYQPAVLRKKVYVIDEVHMLTTEAFNALLKTLEEPPPHVTFVLATTEPHKLPNTILSRCQRYDFKLVPASRLAQHLSSIFVQEKLAIEPGAVSLVVRESGGSVRDALSLCDQLISYVGDATMTERHVAEVLGVADRSLTRTLVRALAGGDAGAALAAVESAIERGVDEVQLARAIVRYLRDLSVLQVAPGRRGLVDATDEELAELAAEANELERSRITQMFERMLRCCDELGKTLQPRLVLDCALIDVATIEPLVPLGDLIERLSELEARLAGKSARVGGGGSSGGGTRDRPRAPAAPATSPRGSAPIRSAAEPASPVASPTVAPAPRSSEARAPSAPVSASVPDGAVSLGASSALGGAAPNGASSSPASVASAGGVANAGPASGGASGGAPSAGPSARAPHSSASSASPSVGAQSVEASSGDGASAASTEGGSSVRSPRPGATAGAPNAGASDVGSGPSRGPESARVESAAPVASERSAAISMQPSGPVPRSDVVASGSGPHDRAGPAPSAHAGASPTPKMIGIPASPAEALRAWDEVLSALDAQRKVSLSALFHHARVMTWTADSLVLGFPFDEHSMGDMAKDRLDELTGLVHTLGPELKNIKVAIRLLDASESQTAGARSILETTRERTSVERSKREAEARAHPIMKHVLQTFGAQIKEIKTDV